MTPSSDMKQLAGYIGLGCAAISVGFFVLCANAQSARTMQQTFQMKTIWASLLITLFTACLAQADGENRYTFYRDYTAPIPSDDYAVLHARSMMPDIYLILFLSERKAYVYSPYQRNGLLYTHAMSQEEYDAALKLLTSEAAREIPESDIKAVMDGFEFRAQWSIDGYQQKFYHILPENPTVMEIYELYTHYRELERIYDMEKERKQREAKRLESKAAD